MPLPPSKPAENLVLGLQAPYGVRTDEGNLILDKRGLSLQVRVMDADGAPTAAVLPMQTILEFEDGEALAPELQATALSGKTICAITSNRSGDVPALKFRINIISSQHNGRRFRLRVSPQDADLTRRMPGLVQVSEPFTMAGHTANAKRYTSTDDKSSGKRPPSQGDDPAAATVTGRKRRFPAPSILESTAAAQRGAPSLTHTAVGLCDRLATMVAQQLTHGAAELARSREHRQLTADDVASFVQRPGAFDFLHHARVIRRADSEGDAGDAVGTAESANKPAAVEI